MQTGHQGPAALQPAVQSAVAAHSCSNPAFSSLLLLLNLDLLCSDDSGAWPPGMGGLGYVKTSSQVACVLATTACAKGQYALAGACANCGSGQSSPNGIRCVFEWCKLTLACWACHWAMCVGRSECWVGRYSTGPRAWHEPHDGAATATSFSNSTQPEPCNHARCTQCV